MKILSFFKEVKTEGKRVVWPSKAEIMQASGLVFVMSIIAALFFMLVDFIVHGLVQFLLGV